LTVKGGKTTQKSIADGDTLLVCDWYWFWWTRTWTEPAGPSPTQW